MSPKIAYGRDDILRDSNFRDTHIEIFDADICNELVKPLHTVLNNGLHKTTKSGNRAGRRYRDTGTKAKMDYPTGVNKNNLKTPPIARRTESPNQSTSIPSLFLTNCLNQAKLNELDLIIDSI